jgi:hypothetical protein
MEQLVRFVPNACENGASLYLQGGFVARTSLSPHLNALPMCVVVGV